MPSDQATRRTVAVLLGTERQFYRDVLRGVGDYLQHRSGWTIAVEPTLLPLVTTQRAFAGMPKGCDGVLAFVEDEVRFEKLRRRGIAVVNLSSVYSHPDLPSVITDNLALSTLAFEHFMERGLRTFAYCDLTVQSRVRRAPFVTLLKNAGFACHVYDVDAARDGDWRTGLDRPRLAEWLAGLPKPIGVLAHNDIRGRHLIEVATQSGIRIPEEVCVLGVDNELPHCELCVPPLSSVDIDAVRLGREAAELLDRVMDGVQPRSLHVEIPPLRVVVRRSTDVCITRDPLVSKAMEFITRHATEGIDTRDVIRHLIVSRTALSKRFLRVLGYTPHEAIVRARLETARRLLGETKLTIDAVAQRAGFRHGEYLTAVFRHRYGVTPRTFRVGRDPGLASPPAVK